MTSSKKKKMPTPKCACTITKSAKPMRLNSQQNKQLLERTVAWRVMSHLMKGLPVYLAALRDLDCLQGWWWGREGCCMKGPSVLWQK